MNATSYLDEKSLLIEMNNTTFLKKIQWNLSRADNLGPIFYSNLDKCPPQTSYVY